MMQIPSMKSKTKLRPIAELPDAEILYLSLSQNIGYQPKPIVQKGDIVQQYQLIAKADGLLSANLHAPVSGEILDICRHSLANGEQCNVIVIKNDFKYNQANFSICDPREMNADQIIERIAAAGVVGEGGAQFPTHIKYTLDNKQIDTFIINGIECEPYLTADYILMKNETEKILQSALIVNKILKAKEITITIKKQNKDLQDVFLHYMNQEPYRIFRLLVLSDQYPQGGELQLIKSVTGKEIRKGTLPRDAGVIVSNVGTIYAIHNAVFESKPVISRIITMSGEKAATCGNFRVKIGTPVSHIMNELGLNYDRNQTQLVHGGAMMGIGIINMSVPICKGTSGILLLEKRVITKKNNCIQCGYCADVCPMRLMPMILAYNYRKGKYEQMETDNLMLCIDCAACEYICPSSVPLTESIRKGKHILQNTENHANRI